MSRPQTLNQGACDERTVWMAKVRRTRRSISDNFPEAQAIVDKLIAWGKSRCERFNAKPKGIGKK